MEKYDKLYENTINLCKNTINFTQKKYDKLYRKEYDKVYRKEYDKLYAKKIR